jgi:hypothetical protein
LELSTVQFYSWVTSPRLTTKYEKLQVVLPQKLLNLGHTQSYLTCFIIMCSFVLSKIIRKRVGAYKQHMLSFLVTAIDNTYFGYYMVHYLVQLLMRSDNSNQFAIACENGKSNMRYMLSSSQGFSTLKDFFQYNYL